MYMYINGLEMPMTDVYTYKKSILVESYTTFIEKEILTFNKSISRFYLYYLQEFRFMFQVSFERFIFKSSTSWCIFHS